MNLLIFHLHDMGRYCSPYGFPMPTPNIERFANSSLLFRNAHCAAPTCSPSRAAMLTGQTAHQAGMLGLVHRGFDLKDYAQHLGSYLGRNGYDTVYAGVQHEFNPEGEQTSPYQRRLEPSTTDGSRDGQAVRATAEYLDQVGDQPFYSWTGLFYPHRPFFEADPVTINPDRVQPPGVLPDTPKTRKDMAEYMATVAHADACFGAVLEALERNGLREKTLVILTTDHGIAFPGMKCNLTTHGTGVALMLDFPGNPMQGKVSDALVSHLDLYPTICDLLDLEAPDHLVGHSVVPLIQGEVEAIREDAFAEVNFHAAREVMRSVRTNRYNYIRIFDENPNVALPNIDAGASKDVWLENGVSSETPRDRVQLYDLVLDPQERHNLAADPAYRDIRLEMDRRLKEWMVRTDDPVMTGSVRAPAGAKVDPREAVDPS
jgi:arylsulfatase A-like enzyme